MTNLSQQLWQNIFTRCSPVLHSTHLRGLWGCWAEFWAVSYLWCCGCRSTLPGTPPAAVTGIEMRVRPKEIILTKQRWRTLFSFFKSPVYWAWRQGCCWSSCSCKSLCPSWSDRHSSAAAWTGWPLPPDCWRTAAPLCTHQDTPLGRTERQ